MVHRRRPWLLASILLIAIVSASLTTSIDRPASATSSARLGDEKRDDGAPRPYLDPLELLGQSGLTAIKGTLGERFAGVWLASRTPPFDVRVAAVAPTSEDEAKVARIFRDSAYPTGIPTAEATLAVVPATFSLDDLEHFKGIVSNKLSEVVATRSPPWPASILGIDTPHNTVLLEVPFELPDFLADLREAVPPGALHVDVRDALDFGYRNASRSDFPPYVGGLLLSQSASSSYVCTSGYVFKTNDAPPYYGSTAGHCEGTGFSNWYIGGDYVGRTSRNYYRRLSPVVDVLMYPIQQNVTSSQIYVSSNALRPVYRRAYLSEIGLNKYVCITPGSLPGGYCGYVYRERDDIQIGSIVHRDIYCADFRVGLSAGDSGSPVYIISGSGAYGAGMHALWEHQPYFTGECFHAVYDIQNQSGLTLGVRS